MRFFALSEKTDVLLALFGLSFIIFGWFVFSLTLASLFLFPLIAFGMAVTLAISFLTAWKLLTRSPKSFVFIFLAALFYATLIGFFSEPTLFSGRDQGSIAEASYRLAENGKLAFSTPGSESFFKIYGEGTALNFPGFAYTSSGSLLTQFPLGYTAWLGSFVSLFSLSGFALGNATLLFLFLVFFYALLRLFVHPYYASAGFTLALVSFLPSWFAKVTLTENLALFLFTFLLFNLILFLRENKGIFYAGILLSGGLLAFTRIEGFALFFMALVVLVFQPGARALFRTSPWKTILFPGIIFTFFLLRDFFLNLPYYKMIGKALMKFLSGFGDGVALGGALGNTNLGSVFFLYGLLLIFTFGLFGLFVFVKEKRYILLLPALITLPVFVYLFSPTITPDHPWMLRRYLFSLFPTLLFSFVVGSALLFDKKKTLPIDRPRGMRLVLVSILFLGFFLVQIPAWSGTLTFAENRDFLRQIEVLTKEFTEKDLILVDRNVSGDGFAMLTGPASFLFKKNTVYFFNPNDLEKLDTSSYEHVYLLVPEGDQERYVEVFGERMTLKKRVIFSLEQLENLPLTKSFSLRLPEKKTVTTHNFLFQLY